MFQQARNLIRQLTHGNDDRRKHQRFATDIRTVCRPVHDGSELAARVSNVSRSGVNLLVDREVPQGTMIRIDLPTGDETQSTTTLLACIMNSREQDGTWSLGCMFSIELADDEMALFGGEKKRSDGSDKRMWVRSPTKYTAEYRVLPGDSSGPSTADVVNISPTGLGMTLNKAIQPGGVLSIALPRNDGQGTMTMLACVVYLSQKGDDQWVAGCNFIRELNERELKQLL
jgi:PilZ domain